MCLCLCLRLCVCRGSSGAAAENKKAKRKRKWSVECEAILLQKIKKSVSLGLTLMHRYGQTWGKVSPVLAAVPASLSPVRKTSYLIWFPFSDIHAYIRLHFSLVALLLYSLLYYVGPSSKLFLHLNILSSQLLYNVLPTVDCFTLIIHLRPPTY